MATVALDGSRFGVDDRRPDPAGDVAGEPRLRPGVHHPVGGVRGLPAPVVRRDGEEHLRRPDGHAADRRPASVRHLHHDLHGAALPGALAALHARSAAAAAADRDARDPEPDAAGDDLLPVGLGARDPPGRLRDRRLPHEGPARLGLDRPRDRLRPARDRDVPDRDREVHPGAVPDRRPHAAVPRVPEAAVGGLAGVGGVHRLRPGVRLEVGARVARGAAAPGQDAADAWSPRCSSS